MTTDAELEERFPGIDWREPVHIVVPGSIMTPSEKKEGLACRFCIAKYGLSAVDVGRLPQTREEWEEHMAQMHGGGR